jgi:outer membrane receptor protein involved in Fe transport
MSLRLHTLNAAASGAVLAALLASAPAMAQGSAAPAAPAADDQGEQVEDIIVIGTAGAGVRRQDAAFALTTLDAAAIDRAQPASTADLFRNVPGVSAESSGGQNGANIFVRGYPSGGDAEYVTLQTEGVPFFPPPTLSFLENTQLFRIDETLQRVEAVRGGTGSLFSSGQPGLTVNFVQRRGGQNFGGLGKISVTDYGDVRGDGYVSGPLGANTTFLVGGYYAAGGGVRDPGFTAEKGGQISGNIEHKFERGKLLVFGRYLNDRGQWLLPIPVVQNGRKISAYPGFDAGTGTLAGSETRLGVRNDGSRYDLADGRGARIVNLGANAEYDLSDAVTLRYRTSWLKGDADTTGLVPAGAPQTAAAYAAGKGGTLASLTFTNGQNSGTLNGNTQVIQSGAWTVRKQLESWVNDLALEFKSGGNTLTAGVYYAAYSSDDQWNLGNGQLLTAEPQAKRLDMTIVNEDGVTQQVTRNGFAQGSFFNVNASYDGKDYAFYAVDEFQVTDALRIDGGIRWQRHEVDGTLENNTSNPDVDGNPNTLYDNGDAQLDGTFRTIRYRGDKFSWTLGANYELSRELGFFARYSRGHNFPFFDNLRDDNRLTQQVDTYEGGVKVSMDLVSAYLTVFHNDFKGLVNSRITNGAPEATTGSARANGVELEGAIRPVQGLSINFAGTWLDGKYKNYFVTRVIDARDPSTPDDDIKQSFSLRGNKVQRQPKWQWRVSPSYEVPFGDNKATIYTTIAYTGDRFSDIENQQFLPNYYKWDAGIIFDLGEHVQAQASIDNITDELGLTEGNPRVVGAQGQVLLARPILGRSARFSVSYKF